MKTSSLFLGLGIALLWNTKADEGVGGSLFASCPIDSSERALDFRGIATDCGSGDNLCTTCVCAIYDAFVPAFQAANVTAESTDLAIFPKARADDILRACVPAYLAPAIAAGVKLSTLTGLQECPADANPACLSLVNDKLRANVSSMTATGEPAAQPAPTGLPTEAIDSVQKTIGSFSNAGQQVVQAGRSIVDAVQSTAQTVQTVFNG